MNVRLLPHVIWFAIEPLNGSSYHRWRRATPTHFLLNLKLKSDQYGSTAVQLLFDFRRRRFMYFLFYMSFDVPRHLYWPAIAAPRFLQPETIAIEFEKWTILNFARGAFDCLICIYVAVDNDVFHSVRQQQKVIKIHFGWARFTETKSAHFNVISMLPGDTTLTTRLTFTIAITRGLIW